MPVGMIRPMAMGALLVATLAVGGCSTQIADLPALAGQPTWHPVPFLLHSGFAREGNAAHFNEQECLKGSLVAINEHHPCPGRKRRLRAGQANA